MTPPSLDNAVPVPVAAPLAAPVAAEVHLWCWSSEPLPWGEQAVSWLDAQEQGRLERFASVALRSRFLAAHLGLRQLLGGYLHRPPGEVQFQPGFQGKPSLVLPASEDTLHFNLSHSGELVLLAVATEEVGVDVERQRPLTAYNSLVQRHLTTRERQTLEQLPPEEQVSHFFQLWTGKEAALKQKGLGLQVPLDQIDLQPNVFSDQESSVLVNYLPGWPHARPPCWLTRLSMPSGYAAAVATALPLQGLHYRQPVWPP